MVVFRAEDEDGADEVVIMLIFSSRQEKIFLYETPTRTPLERDNDEDRRTGLHQRACE
jgi:hypothetical protein